MRASRLLLPKTLRGFEKIGCSYACFTDEETEKLSGTFTVTRMLLGLGLELVFAPGALETQGLVDSVQTLCPGTVS